MVHVQTILPQPHSRAVRALGLTLLTFVSSLCLAQGARTAPKPDVALQEQLKKYPDLLPEFGRVMQRLQREVNLPADRKHSDLLPLLPESTIGYLAFPNYGDAAGQVLTIFRQELQKSPDLRAWWTHGDMLTAGPKIENFVENFSQLSGYLGDEVVICGMQNLDQADLLIVARVRKPGVRAALQKMVLGFADKAKAGVTILDPKELASAQETPGQLFVVLRPDLVIASTNLSRLRSFNSRLDHGARDFPSNPFAQRILRSYENGVSIVGALDLQKLMASTAKGPDFAKVQRAGFADVKYVVWERRSDRGQAELSFTGPRHGIASWLGSPTYLGSLDFVSPKSVFVTSLVLNDPAKMFLDIQELSGSSPQQMAQIAVMEQALGISLKNDIFGQLSGETTIEVDTLPPADPSWRAMVGIKDVHRFQQTLGIVLKALHFPTEQYTEAGIVFNLVHASSPKGPNNFAFAFVNDYLVIASSPESLSEAVQIHESGDSLRNSPRFQHSIPGSRPNASALLYYDPSALIALQLQQKMGNTVDSLSQIIAKGTPTSFWFYGEDDAIREANVNSGVDAGVVLMGAAVAIPNLMRSRVAANEASAVGKIRTVNTAQVAYAIQYPDRGFAPDLATLGPDIVGGTSASADHAALLDSTLGNRTCTAGTWCTSSGYRFSVKGRCGLGKCNDFVAVATPITTSSGTRTFCSTADGVIRTQVVAPLTTPVSVNDCEAWRPLQ